MSSKKLFRFPALLALLTLLATSAYSPAPSLDRSQATISAAAPQRRTLSPLPSSPAPWLPSLSQASSAAAPPLPLILLPGMTGSRMENDPDRNGVYGEVWPNGDRLIFDPWDLTLLQLKLAPNGADPFSQDPSYATVRVGDIIRTEYFLDYYASTINYFINKGYTEGKDFFVCPYDWRKDILEIAYGTLPQTLDKCVDLALAKNPGAGRVNILAHSMGGLVARAYLTEPSKAQKVQRLITLGSPFLGAPEILLAIFDDLCFAEWLGLCFTNPAVLYELIQNYPAGYEIAPGADYFKVYSQGYFRRDRDANRDGRRDGYLDASSVYRLLSEHNAQLSQRAQALYTRLGGWNNGGTNGVEVYMMVGDQHASIGTIVEYEEFAWYNPWGPPTIAYRTEPVNGDGTIPLHSADLRDLAHSVDLTGGVRVFYFNLDHGELPTDPNVLQFAAQIFESPPHSDVDALLSLQDSTASGAAQADGPRTDPLPLNGQWLTIEGPVQVEVSDAAGHRIASPESSLGGQSDIPGASMTQMDGAVYLFLPQGETYEIRLQGQEAAAVDIRLQTIVGDQTAQTVLFNDLAVKENSQALIHLDTTATSTGDISLDQDGDGVYEASIPPGAVLNAEESLDTTPPVTRFTIQGSFTPEGAYISPVTISLAAVDNPGGAGVAKIEYSLDEGKTVLPYSGPFQADPRSVQVILARAADRAGNEEAPLSSARLIPGRIFVPSLLR